MDLNASLLDVTGAHPTPDKESLGQFFAVFMCERAGLMDDDGWSLALLGTFQTPS